MRPHLPLQGLIYTPLHKSGILGTDQNSRLQPVGQGVSFSENKGHQGFALVNGDFLRLDGSKKFLQTLVGGEIIFELKNDHQVSEARVKRRLRDQLRWVEGPAPLFCRRGVEKKLAG